MLFILHVSRDELPIELALSLMRLYPEARKLSIVDGYCGDGWIDAAPYYGFKVMQSPRLKPARHGTRWLQRWINAAANHSWPREIVVRIDADCIINRPFILPQTGDIWGHVACHRHHRITYDRGGITAYPRETLIRIKDSELLHDPVYTTTRYQYRNRGETFHCESLTMASIAHRLGLTHEPWPDVYNCSRDYTSLIESDTFAVVAALGRN